MQSRLLNCQAINEVCTNDTLSACLHFSRSEQSELIASEEFAQITPEQVNELRAYGEAGKKSAFFPGGIVRGKITEASCFGSC